MFGLKKWRRKRSFRNGLNDNQLAILRDNVPYYDHLPDNLRSKLEGLTNVFLDEKSFEGCAGLNLTKEIKVTIAAQACILLLGIDDLSTFYEGLRSVLVYPETYVARIKNQNNGIFVEEGYQQRQGEAWERGHVVLAWNEVKRGARDISDGQNLVFHEFAHQLDYDYGATSQINDPESNYMSWPWVIGNEYNNLLEALRRNQKTLIDEYGAQNVAEFFAVVTEYFFEKPIELRQKHPDLYQQLTEFYRQDPAAYIQS